MWACGRPVYKKGALPLSWRRFSVSFGTMDLLDINLFPLNLRRTLWQVQEVWGMLVGVGGERDGLRSIMIEDLKDYKRMIEEEKMGIWEMGEFWDYRDQIVLYALVLRRERERRWG